MDRFRSFQFTSDFGPARYMEDDMTEFSRRQQRNRDILSKIQELKLRSALGSARSETLRQIQIQHKALIQKYSYRGRLSPQRVSVDDNPFWAGRLPPNRIIYVSTGINTDLSGPVEPFGDPKPLVNERPHDYQPRNQELRPPERGAETNPNQQNPWLRSDFPKSFVPSSVSAPAPAPALSGSILEDAISRHRFLNLSTSESDTVTTTAEDESRGFQWSRPNVPRRFSVSNPTAAAINNLFTDDTSDTTASISQSRRHSVNPQAEIVRTVPDKFESLRPGPISKRHEVEQVKDNKMEADHQGPAETLALAATNIGLRKSNKKQDFPLGRNFSNGHFSNDLDNSHGSGTGGHQSPVHGHPHEHGHPHYVQRSPAVGSDSFSRPVIIQPQVQNQMDHSKNQGQLEGQKEVRNLSDTDDLSFSDAEGQVQDEGVSSESKFKDDKILRKKSLDTVDNAHVHVDLNQELLEQSSRSSESESKETSRSSESETKGVQGSRSTGGENNEMQDVSRSSRSEIEEREGSKAEETLTNKIETDGAQNPRKPDTDQSSVPAQAQPFKLKLGYDDSESENSDKQISRSKVSAAGDGGGITKKTKDDDTEEIIDEDDLDDFFDL